MENLHYLFENPWQASLPLPGGNDVAGKRKLSFEFLKAVESESDFETSPMYALGHEAIYCNGPGESSAWSAQRIMAEFPGMHCACVQLASMRLLVAASEVLNPLLWASGPSVVAVVGSEEVGRGGGRQRG